MKVFITGSAGFIGANLSNALVKEGYEVAGIDNYFHSCDLTPEGQHEFGDILFKDDMDHYIQWCDVVVHLAAQIHVDYSIKFPQKTIDTNVTGTLNVLELCRKYNKKCVVASTSEVYGSSQCDLMSELHPLDAQSPYGASKVAADRLAKSYTDTYGMNIVIVRNFNAFGPYQNDGSYGSVISRFTKAALENKPIQIYGDGTQERDYMYIDDIVQAYKFAIDKLPAGVYNFGTGKTQTINSIAAKISNFVKQKAPITHVVARAGEVQRLCCDITKVKSFGFVPNTDFDRDLERYINWYWSRK